MAAIAFADAVHGAVQAYHFGRIFKHVELLRPLYHITEFNADQPYQHTPLVQTFEQVFYHGYQYMVEGSVRYPFLERMRVEIRITDFYCNARGKLFALP